ncbi:MAG TPA: acetyl-CoA carboxylase biotin carboxyl carrier protein, partial [Longimicrobiales bacterium]
NGSPRAAARAAASRQNGDGLAQASTETGRLMIDLDFLRGLIDAVDGSGIDSIEINRAGTKIRIAKTPPPAPLAAAAPALSPLVAPALAAAAAVPALGPAPASSAAATEEPALSHLTEVKSPMVGTFYRAPAPEAPPYVEVGSVVKKGQTLCILEAMKLMNELESEVDGVVREILVENSDPVEYGQVLFRIEPA